MRVSPRVSDRGHMRSSPSFHRRPSSKSSGKTAPAETRRTSAHRERPADSSQTFAAPPPCVPVSPHCVSLEETTAAGSSLNTAAVPDALSRSFFGTLLQCPGAAMQSHQFVLPAQLGSPSERARSPVHSPKAVTRANCPPSPPALPFRFIHAAPTPSRSMALPVGGPGALPRGRSVALPVGGTGTHIRVQAPPAVAVLPLTPPNCMTTHDSGRVSMPTLARYPSPTGYRSPGARCRSPSGRSPTSSTLNLTWNSMFEQKSPGQPALSPKQQAQVRRTCSSDDAENIPLLASVPTLPAGRSNSLDSACLAEICASPTAPQLFPPRDAPHTGKKGASVQTYAAPDPPQQVRLDIGSVVEVDSRTLCVTAAIGEGSFGTVWGAKIMDDDRHCTEVALKEVPCRSKQALAEAAFEGSLLGALSSASSRGAFQEAAKRIPTLFGLQVDHAGAQTWRVRVAMSRLPGEPLWKFVERWPSPNWDTKSYERRICLANATKLAKELLLQLSPTLEFVSTRAYHRDVTPRNILIETREGEPPRFGLIDFGLAVDAAHWRLGVSTVPSLQRATGVPAWRQAGVAGDGRYWPVSSWYMFGYGPNELERKPGLCLEYKMQLDLHSLGISALQVFVEMLPTDHRREDRVSCEESNLILRLRTLQSAWRHYWQDASKFWQCIYDTFRSDGDFKALKAAYVRAGVHEVVRRNLSALRDALQELRDTAQAEPQDTAATPQLCNSLSALAEALLAMIGTGEKVDHAAGWASVSEILSATVQQRRGRGIEAAVSTKLEEGSNLSTPPTSPSTSALPAAQTFGSPETASPETQSASPASSASCHALSPEPSQTKLLL